MKRTLFNSKALVLVVLTLLGGYIPLAFAQAEGPEPNNPCTSAQDFGAVGFPFAVEGNLDATVSLDVDFFKFRGNPGDAVRVDLQGVTLYDPMLAFYDSTCNRINVSDNFINRNSRLLVKIPIDGVFILAVTGGGDFQFDVGGNGTYSLNISPFLQVGSISGRVVNAENGSPLPGETDPFATVQLYFFDGSFNHPVNQMVTSSDGRFRFTTDFQGQPLDAGTYVVFTSATDYQQGPPAEILDITAGENRDIGDISLQPFIFIGSISGRAVDAVTHKPLAENIDSFTSVILYLCDDFFGCSQADIVNTDKEGRFQFSGAGSNTRLQPGSYSIGIFSDQYQPKQIDTFEVTLAGENRDVGDIPVQSFPVRFTQKTPCIQAPKKGGNCQYSVTIANGLATPLNDDAWSIVQGFGIGSPLSETTFQPNVIQRLALKAGESKNVKFDFSLPNTVSDGAIICAKAFVGRRPIATWDTVGAADLFCITKGAIGFSYMPEKEVHKMRGRAFMPQK